MNNRLPEVLTPTSESYIFQVNQQLPNFLSAFYIVGSIALDEFNPHFSDVDFVAVTNHLATDGEIEVLRQTHQEVEQHYSRWKLSGMYLLQNDLGKSKEEIGTRLVFHDGNLKLQTNFDASPVTWWILKNGGIPVLGIDPRKLPIAIDESYLVAWMLENMNTYWKSWTQRPSKLIILLIDWGIQWTVLGVARQFYTIREKRFITKQRSGEYALSVVPQKWHRILKEAIRLRAKSAGSLYRSRIVRMLDAVNFMKFIIKSSNEMEFL